MEGAGGAGTGPHLRSDQNRDAVLPRNAIMYVSMVDAGTVEMVRSAWARRS